MLSLALDTPRVYISGTGPDTPDTVLVRSPFANTPINLNTTPQSELAKQFYQAFTNDDKTEVAKEHLKVKEWVGGFNDAVKKLFTSFLIKIRDSGANDQDSAKRETNKAALFDAVCDNKSSLETMQAVAANLAQRFHEFSTAIGNVITCSDNPVDFADAEFAFNQFGLSPNTIINNLSPRAAGVLLGQAA